jgi:predicted acylesterase/phospholipase RssA
MIDTLCLGGGGMKAFSFIGILDFLTEVNYININIFNNYIGTSSGAIISFLLSINYTILELKEFILNFNFNILKNNLNIENLIINLGLDNGNKIMYIIQSFLKNKLNKTDISFKEHFDLTKKKLTIIGTNYTKSCEEVFNFEKTPNMSIITAIRISISIPLIFTPVYFNEYYYIDGGLLNNFPINYCIIENTLGINIINNKNNNLDNIALFIKNCINIIIKKNYKSLNIIEINDSDLKLNNIIDLDINYEEKLFLIKFGYDQANKYVNDLSYNICLNIIDDIILNI